MILDTNSKKLISIFESAGYNAYAVGGCVRDSLMDLPFSDVDIAVSCTPDVTCFLLSENNVKFYNVGIKHGTVAAVLEGKSYEITTFRTESGYADNRHPDAVTFVNDIKDDLSRRDFTVNAMAYNESDGLVDVFGGADDINAKIIRAVGDADLRFNEDALRILRALRFSSTLDFTIDKSTSDSIFKNKHLIKNVARERITEELKKLVCGEGVSRVLIDYYEIFNIIFDNNYDVKKYSEATKKINNMPKDSILRIATLFRTLENEYLKIKNSVVLSNEQYDRIKNIYEYNFDCNVVDKKAVKRVMSKVGYSKACDLFWYYDKKEALNCAGQIIESNEAFNLSHLAINGNDLKKVGFEGKDIKDMLNYALEAVIDEIIPNAQKNILDYILKK